eukprot:915935-Rhodomonas_salina.1
MCLWAACLVTAASCAHRAHRTSTARTPWFKPTARTAHITTPRTTHRAHTMHTPCTPHNEAPC